MGFLGFYKPPRHQGLLTINSDNQPKHKWAANYKNQLRGETHCGNWWLWNQRRGKGRTDVFHCPVSFFTTLLFPLCLIEISRQLGLSLPDFWGLNCWQSKRVPWQNSAPGDVDTDSRGSLCQSFWTCCSQGTCSQGLWAVLLPMGLCFKDWLRWRGVKACSAVHCTTSNSPLGPGARANHGSCVHLDRSTGRASFLMGSDIGGGDPLH